MQRACVECWHCRIHHHLVMDPPLYCGHPDVIVFDLVKGHMAPACEKARDAKGVCGPTGKFWTPKPPKLPPVPLGERLARFWRGMWWS